MTPLEISRREVPQFLDGWNAYRGERIQILTGTGLLITGRLDALLSNADGNCHSVKLDVEQIVSANQRLQPESLAVFVGKTATIPGHQVVLLTFAD